MGGCSLTDVLVLWDLDGTLLNAGGVGGDLYSAVFAQMFGRPAEVLAPMAGRTDRAIILQTLTMAGVPEPRRHVDPFIAGLTARAPSAREAVALRGHALPGAAAALAALASGRSLEAAGFGRDRRVHQSVLTGNIRPVAEVKLAALGLRDPLDLRIGAYGDDHEERTELVRVARRRATAAHVRSACPAGFQGPATVVVGDTPLDISAALAAGARAVGVASGSSSAAELRAAGAHFVLPDLVDTRRVLTAILSLGGVGRVRPAARRTGLQPPGPASLLQRPRHLSGRDAAMAGNVIPVIAQRRAAVGRGVVVASPVSAVLLSGVG